MQRDPNFTLVYTLHASGFWLEFPEQWDPQSVWTDKRVRLAVAYSISLAMDATSLYVACNSSPGAVLKVAK